MTELIVLLLQRQRAARMQKWARTEGGSGRAEGAKRAGAERGAGTQKTGVAKLSGCREED